LNIARRVALVVDVIGFQQPLDRTELVGLVEELLHGLGYAPVGFTSSTEALQALRDDPYRYAAVITDEVMPWLTGTAFLHSVMIQERRRMLRLWNLALVILTFTLTLFGTFLTRSGVIASVHAFTQGSIGIFFLTFLSLVVLVALGLLAWRWETLGAQGELDSVVSRESAFLLNNVLLVAATFTVFFGTIFPLVSEALRGIKVSVGMPFFNQVNVPLFLGLIFLMGVGPLIAWRRASIDNLKRNFLWPAVVGIVGAAVVFALGVRSTLAVLSLALAAFVSATIAVDVARATRARVRVGEAIPRALPRDHHVAVGPKRHPQKLAGHATTTGGVMRCTTTLTSSRPRVKSR